MGNFSLTFAVCRKRDAKSPYCCLFESSIDHFTVVCLVAWPLNESEAGVDLSLLFFYKFLLIKTRSTPAGFLPTSVVQWMLFYYHLNIKQQLLFLIRISFNHLLCAHFFVSFLFYI